MLTLHGASASPFVRKVLLVLEHKQLPFTQLPVTPFAPPANWAELSPLGKIPVLVDGDLVLPDSSVICRYLEEAHPEPALYPATPAARALACWYEEFGDTALVEAVAPFFAERIVQARLLGNAANEARLADVTANVLPKALAYLERIVPASGFLFGEALCIADIAIASQLLNGELGGCPLDATRYPRTVAWFARVKATPLFTARAVIEAKELAAMLG